MKNIYGIGVIPKVITPIGVLLLVIFIIPTFVYASWWNPFSWFKKVNSTTAVATSTLISTTTINSDTTTTKREEVVLKVTQKPNGISPNNSKSTEKPSQKIVNYYNDMAGLYNAHISFLETHISDFNKEKIISQIAIESLEDDILNTRGYADANQSAKEIADYRIDIWEIEKSWEQKQMEFITKFINIVQNDVTLAKNELSNLPKVISLDTFNSNKKNFEDTAAWTLAQIKDYNEFKKKVANKKLYWESFWDGYAAQVKTNYELAKSSMEKELSSKANTVIYTPTINSQTPILNTRCNTQNTSGWDFQTNCYQTAF